MAKEHLSAACEITKQLGDPDRLYELFVDLDIVLMEVRRERKIRET